MRVKYCLQLGGSRVRFARKGRGGVFWEENLSKRRERLLSDLWSEHVGYSQERHVPQPAHASRPAAAGAVTGISPAVARFLSRREAEKPGRKLHSITNTKKLLLKMPTSIPARIANEIFKGIFVPRIPRSGMVGASEWQEDAGAVSGAVHPWGARKSRGGCSFTAWQTLNARHGLRRFPLNWKHMDGDNLRTEHGAVIAVT